MIERQRASLTTEATKIGFVGNKQQVYGRLVALLVAAGRAAEAFDVVERSKARALVDMLAGKKDFTARGPDPEKAPKRVLAELDRADTEARAMTVAAAPGAEAAPVRSARAMQADMRSAAPELASLVTVSTAALEELRALLAADEALIEYYYDESALYAFVVTRGGVQATTLERAGLAELVNQLRRRIEEPASEAWRAPARGLHDRLIAPLEAQIKARHLVLVPHGALHYLPFAALTGADERPLDRALRDARAAERERPQVPASTRRSARNAPACWRWATPSSAMLRWRSQFAEPEAARSGGPVSPARACWCARTPPKSNFQQGGGAFSPHPPRDPRQVPRRNAARLRADAWRSDGEHDGLLAVAELYSMDPEADLVTLSACETGLGKVANGDDVVGLTRGFLYAGAAARSLSSLWSVEDRATAELMKSFYEGLGTPESSMRCGTPSRHPRRLPRTRSTGRHSSSSACRSRAVSRPSTTSPRSP